MTNTKPTPVTEVTFGTQSQNTCIFISEALRKRTVTPLGHWVTIVLPQKALILLKKMLQNCGKCHLKSLSFPEFSQEAWLLTSQNQRSHFRVSMVLTVKNRHRLPPPQIFRYAYGSHTHISTEPQCITYICPFGWPSSKRSKRRFNCTGKFENITKTNKTAIFLLRCKGKKV